MKSFFHVPVEAEKSWNLWDKSTSCRPNWETSSSFPEFQFKQQAWDPGRTELILQLESEGRKSMSQIEDHQSWKIPSYSEGQSFYLIWDRNGLDKPHPHDGRQSFLRPLLGVERSGAASSLLPALFSSGGEGGLLCNCSAQPLIAVAPLVDRLQGTWTWVAEARGLTRGSSRALKNRRGSLGARCLVA